MSIDIKQLVADAKIFNNDIKVFVDVHKDIANASKDLGDVLTSGANYERLLKTSQTLAKIGAGLGMLGIGLGLFTSLITAGEKSESQLVFEKLTELDSKLDKLNKKIGKLPDRFRDIVKFSNALIEFSKLSDIDVTTYSSDMADYLKHQQDNNAELLAQTKKRILEQTGSTKVLQTLNGLVSVATNPDSGLLWAAYKDLNGDVALLTDIYQGIFQNYLVCQSYYTLVFKLETERDNPQGILGHGFDQNEVWTAVYEHTKEKFEAQMNQMTSAFSSILLQCNSDILSNAKKYCENFVDTQDVVINDIKQDDSKLKEFINKLDNSYPFKCWIAIKFELKDKDKWVRRYELNGRHFNLFPNEDGQEGTKIFITWQDSQEITPKEVDGVKLLTFDKATSHRLDENKVKEIEALPLLETEVVVKSDRRNQVYYAKKYWNDFFELVTDKNFAMLFYYYASDPYPLSEMVQVISTDDSQLNSGTKQILGKGLFDHNYNIGYLSVSGT